MGISEPHPKSSSSIATVIRPGVMISNAWPQSRATAGATARAIASVLSEHPFFECFQTVDVPTAEERQEIRRLLRDHGHPLTYTLTRVLGERGLSLSSLDASNRALAREVVIAQMPAAVEAGAQALCVISGPRPRDPAARGDALAALEDSLARVCAAARETAPGLEILIEPLDHSAHKRNTLGSTAEAVGICERLAARGIELELCVDTAHLVLNEESPVRAVTQARKHIAEFHFCNCCVDRSHPMFGDRHLPFGAPGVVDEAQIGAWMRQLRQLDFFNAATRPRVFCEVWKPDAMDSLAVVAHCEAALKNGWALGTNT